MVLLVSFMVLFPNGLKAECDDSIETIEIMIVKEAIKQGISVDLALAVARVESNFNPKAKGTKGEIGLYQIMPYHTKLNLWDVKTNIKFGIYLLKQFSIKCADMGNYWVICFNNGVNRRPKYPNLHPYYQRILWALK